MVGSRVPVPSLVWVHDERGNGRVTQQVQVGTIDHEN
jgi:hypothetical protein